MRASPASFEQQVRAITGLPLGSTELLRPAAMVNLLGDSVGGRRTQLGRRVRLPGREAPSLREDRASSRPEDGTPYRPWSHAGRGAGAGHCGAGCTVDLGLRASAFGLNLLRRDQRMRLTVAIKAAALVTLERAVSPAPAACRWMIRVEPLFSTPCATTPIFEHVLARVRNRAATPFIWITVQTGDHVPV